MIPGLRALAPGPDTELWGDGLDGVCGVHTGLELGLELGSSQRDPGQPGHCGRNPGVTG